MSGPYRLRQGRPRIEWFLDRRIASTSWGTKRAIEQLQYGLLGHANSASERL
jgi:hypothetical protein